MKKQNILRLALQILLAICVLTICSIPVWAKDIQEPLSVSVAAPRCNYATQADSHENTQIILPQELKNLLRTAVLQTQPEVIVADYDIPYTHEYLQAVADYLYDYVPEAFHLHHVGCQFYTSGTFYSFTFSYTCSAEEYALQYEECIAAAKKLLSGIKNNNSLTDIEKALLLHDRLALHCEYGDVYADDSETSTLYAALVGRKPVCQGYAVAYLYLLQQIGIKSEIVSSDALFHAWNIVYIDNRPYHVDVTWDDPVPDVYGRVLHNNFLLSTTALKNGVNGSSAHDADDYTSTPVSTEFDNYYWQNSETAFQLVDGEIYYIDNIRQELRRVSDQSKVCSVSGSWKISNQGHSLIGNLAKLACVDGTLYCSMPTAIYTIDLKNGNMTQFAVPTLKINNETFYCIRGFAYENNILYLNYCNYTNGNINTAQTQITKEQPACTHAITELRNAITATCVKDGYTGDRYCTKCGIKTATGTIVPSTGNHTWNGGTVTTEPDCHTTGIKTFSCIVCSGTRTQTIAIDKTNHNGGTKTVNTSPSTCGKDGYSGDIVCLGCDETISYGSAIPATGNHTWDNGTVTIVPTESTSGEKTFTCTQCKNTKTETVPPVEKEEPAYGDLDGDGNITSSDARSALRAAAGLDTLTADLQILADVDRDGNITANDARYILRFAVGLEKHWPAN